MQQILFIGKVWPEPNSSAAGSRTLQLIELFLNRGYQVAFACAANESEFSSNLLELGIQPYPIQLNNSSFNEFVKQLNPHFVIFDRFTIEEQFGWRVAESCPNAMRVLDTIDLHCLREARHAAIREQREFNNADLFNEVAKRELASIYRCDLTLMISSFEMELLTNFFKIDSAYLHYTPFLLNTLKNEDVSNWTEYENTEDFISIGNFLHEPNWDSVLYLKQVIWPKIRKQLPSAQLNIYGAYPSQKVFQLHNQKEGFIIKGRAEDAKQVMKCARVCLAPLRFGAGMKGKLLDAMLYGTPSVTSSVGSEAMHSDLPWNGFIANNPEEFASAAAQLYLNKHEWQEKRMNAIKIINEVFSKQIHGEKLIHQLNAVYQDLQTHRKHNFIGAILQQQQLAATKYMSLWIETKTKLGQKQS